MSPSVAESRRAQFSPPWPRHCSNCLTRAWFNFPHKITHCFSLLPFARTACPHLPLSTVTWQWDQNIVTRINLMHTKMNLGCAWLLCNQSRWAKAFIHHFNAYKHRWVWKGDKAFPPTFISRAQKDRSVYHLNSSGRPRWEVHGQGPLRNTYVCSAHHEKMLHQTPACLRSEILSWHTIKYHWYNAGLLDTF